MMTSNKRTAFFGLVFCFRTIFCSFILHNFPLQFTNKKIKSFVDQRLLIYLDEVLDGMLECLHYKIRLEKNKNYHEVNRKKRPRQQQQIATNDYDAEE